MWQPLFKWGYMDSSMVEKIGIEIENFSKVNRTRCFLHIVNLVAKSMLKLFKMIKKGLEDNALQHKLNEMAEDLELEEVTTPAFRNGITDNNKSTEDDVDGLVDEAEELSEEECAEIRAQIRPIMLVLTKVSDFAQVRG
jgi:hypothetical protein